MYIILLSFSIIEDHPYSRPISQHQTRYNVIYHIICHLPTNCNTVLHQKLTVSSQQGVCLTSIVSIVPCQISVYMHIQYIHSYILRMHVPECSYPVYSSVWCVSNYVGLPWLTNPHYRVLRLIMIGSQPTATVVKVIRLDIYMYMYMWVYNCK